MVDIARLGLEIDSSQVKTANRELDRLEKRGASVQSRFKNMGRSAQQLGQSMSLYVTAPIVAGGAVAVKTASEYERLQVQLEVLVGSAEKAERVFNRLTEFAATTPFELEGITQANNLLLGFGFTTERAFEMLGTLGDIAAVSGADLKTLARITGEARAENKLLTRDLRQLVSNGVPIIKLLSESLGVAEGAIFDMASEGEISFERLVDAFEKATAAGGMYENGMEKLSKTMSGLWSNFIDATDQALSKLGNTVIGILDLKQVLRDVIAQIERATDWFNELEESQQRMIITLTGILAAAGPVIFMLGSLSLAIGAISPVVAGVAAAVAVGTAAILNNWEEVEKYFTTGGGAKMWDDLKSIVSGTIDLIKSIWMIFGEDVMRITSDAFQTILEIVESTLTKINNAVKFWSAVFNGEIKKALGIAVDDFQESFGNIWDILKKVLSLSWSVQPIRLWRSYLKNVFSESEEEAKDLNTKIANIFEQEGLQTEPWRFGVEWRFGDGLNSFENQAKETVENFVRGLDGIELPIKIPEDDMVGEMNRVLSELNDMLNDVDISLPDKIFPPGSVGELRKRMSELNDQIEYMNDPERIRKIQEEIDRLQAKIKELTGAAREQNDMARQLGFTFSSAFEDAILSGNSLRDVLAGLLDDIARIILRIKVIEPLTNALGRYLGNLGSASGNTSGSADEMFGWGTGVPTTLQSMQPVGASQPYTGGGELHIPNMGGGSGSKSRSQSQSVKVIINNNTGAQIETRERRTQGGREVEVVVGRAVQNMFNSGKMDKVMSANYGVRRGGVNRG